MSKNLEYGRVAEYPQLEDAKTALSNAQKASEDHAALVRQKAYGFQQQQEYIDRNLMAITGSTTSDEAVKKFETSMSKLRRLEVATGYMELLREVDQLGFVTQYCEYFCSFLILSTGKMLVEALYPHPDPPCNTTLDYKSSQQL
jgi:hypothetical protein